MLDKKRKSLALKEQKAGLLFREIGYVWFFENPHPHRHNRPLFFLIVERVCLFKGLFQRILLSEGRLLPGD